MRNGPFFAAVATALSISGPSLIAQVTLRVSVSSAGVQGNGPSALPRISADGRFVAFESAADNLVPDDTNGVRDIFVHDLRTGETTRDSVASDGTQGNAETSFFGRCSLSADGRFVAFASDATNLVPGDANGVGDIFVRDRLTGTTSLVSIATDGTQANNRSAFPTLSADGRLVVFISYARNLTPPLLPNYLSVYVHDRQTGATEMASVNSSGEAAAHSSTGGSISADGRFVAFDSFAYNMFPNDNGYSWDTFVRDRLTGVTTLVGSNAAGTAGNQGSNGVRISADGRYAVFYSPSSNLAPEDTDGGEDVFVRDLQTGTTELVSKSSAGVNGNGSSNVCAVSSDGRFVAFTSTATNLVPDDTNQCLPLGSTVPVPCNDVFVHDRLTGETVRASVDSAGGEGNEDSGEYDASISADGRLVTFESSASNLVPDDTASCLDSRGQDYNCTDVFVRDRSGVRLTSIVPATGSELGGEFVTLRGLRFTSSADTTVNLGGSPAIIVDVTSSRITARTPPGSGIADITMRNSLGSDTLAAAFSYVDPALAARYGNVNVALGDRENVLLANASAGDALSRVVGLRAGEAVTLVMTSPSSRQNARFALYAWAGVPDRSTLSSLPRGLGRIVFPVPFTGGTPQPGVVWNNAGYRGTLGAPSHPSSPAPSIVFRRPRGIPMAGRVTLQGLIQDDGAATREGWSVTNAVILQIN